MTNSPPPSPRRRLSLDELIAIIVAFLTVGALLFWGLTRNGSRFRFLNKFFNNDTPVIAIKPGIEEVPGGEEESQVIEEPKKTVVPKVDAEGEKKAVGNRPESLYMLPPLVREEEATAQQTAPEDTEKKLRFPDVPLDYWAYPFIEKVAEENIVKGAEDGNFYPDQPVTREEFAIQLSRAFGDEAEAIAEVQFEDVTTQNDSFTQIAKSVKTGFLKGYPQNTFRPQQEIPRYQVLVALASGFTLQPPSEPAKTLDIFQDKNQLPQWATNQVAAATENGLVVNHPDPNLLKPEQAATRAEVAAMIYQALVEAGKAEAVPSEYVISPQEAN